MVRSPPSNTSRNAVCRSSPRARVASHSAKPFRRSRWRAYGRCSEIEAGVVVMDSALGGAVLPEPNRVPPDENSKGRINPPMPDAIPRALSRSYPYAACSLAFSRCERTTRAAFLDEPGQMLVESNRAPVAHDVGRQANDGAPEHAPAHRREAFVPFEIDVERHAGQ